MVVIGVDPHKNTHTMVAVNEVGKALGEKTVPATTTGHRTAIRWARRLYGLNLRWALEDSRAMTMRLEHDLLEVGGQIVVRVPSSLMARVRRSSRQRGKSDWIDALATARAALREPSLPTAQHNRHSRALKLLVDRRDDLVQHRTAVVQRLLWRLHELDPVYRIKPGALNWSTTRTAVGEWLDDLDGLVAELARDELNEIALATPQINQLEKRLAQQVQTYAPSLLELYGCGAVTAARIVGQAADIRRFRSEASFARYIGLAPVPYSSGSTSGRMRSHRGGNRELNAACHQIAMIQIKRGGPAEDYYRRRRSTRDLHGYAINGVKRRVARNVYNRLRADSDACLVLTPAP